VSKHHWGWECELDSSIEVTTLTVEIYNGRVEVTAECSIRDWPDYKIPREQMEMLTAFYWEGSGDRRQLILDLGESWTLGIPELISTVERLNVGPVGER
jgi:hypothetical protein